MPCFCNSTLSSSPDRDEWQYWSSFQEKPFCCGDRMQVYKGKLNGKGPRGGDFSVVKVFCDQPGTETRCCKELLKAKTAADLLARFLGAGGHGQDRIRTARLQRAPIDQVSLLNKLFSHSKRRPSSGEWILLEEMLQEPGSPQPRRQEKVGGLVPFVDKYGRMYRDREAVTGSGGTAGLQCSLDSRHLLEALVHFSHVASGGQLVLCGLEGLESDKGQVVIKTPVVHSESKAFGDTDLGQRGIREVMSRHVCNVQCRRVLRLAAAGGGGEEHPLPSPTRPLSAPPYSSYPSSPSSLPESLPYRRPRVPSAPVDPAMLCRCDVVDSLPSAPPYEEEDSGIDVPYLPPDVFHQHSPPGMEELKMIFRLELEQAMIPDDPPPPYTEFIEDLM